MAVEKVHPDYKRMLERWTRCRDVAAGQDAVHEAGPLYLPMLKDQTPADYAAYVTRGTFYNATWRTIAGLEGMLFRQPPKVEAPEGVKEYFDDVTMSGVPLHLFVQNVCEEALKEGRIGILVDYPTVEAATMTMAQALAQNLRPTMQSYLCEAIINWRTGRVKNKTVLTMVVLKESASLPGDSEFEEKAEDRYRVLDLIEYKDEADGQVKWKYRVRVFKIERPAGSNAVARDVLLEDFTPLMRGQPLDYIPFVFIGTDDVTPEVDDPPLIDLVNLNLAHYRSTADYEHGCHFTGLPTLFLKGFRRDNDSDKIYIGSQAAIVTSAAEADGKFIEFTGQGLSALEKNLASKEQQMAILGARMLEQQKKGVEAADTASIHRKGEESMLSGAAQAISLGVTHALKWFVDWAGADSAKVLFELNRDFYPQAMTPQQITALVSAWQQGAISEQVLFENLQQGEIIGQDVTLEEEQARKASEGPKLTGQPDDAPAPLEKPAGPQPIHIHLPKGGGKRTVTNAQTGAKYHIEEAA